MCKITYERSSRSLAEQNESRLPANHTHASILHESESRMSIFVVPELVCIANRPTISALGYPRYDTPISVGGDPSIQSVQWLNMFDLQVYLWHYTQISVHWMVEKRQSMCFIREFLVSFAVSVRELKTTNLWIWPPISSPKRCFLRVKRASKL